jgi:phosphatidylglycerophosphatase A
VSQFRQRVLVLIATGFGVGYARVAPGTFGSLLGLPFAWGLCAAGWHPALFAALAAAVFLLGVWASTAAGAHFGRHDPPACVIDEIAAFPVVFGGVALGLYPFSLLSAALGFGLFRLFDIWKPPPVRALERLPRGWGVMADDLMAGVYAGVCLWVAMTLYGRIP